MAKTVHKVLGLGHYSRSDFIINPKRGIYFLEVDGARRQQAIDRVLFFDRRLYVDGPTSLASSGYHPLPSDPTVLDLFDAPDGSALASRWHPEGGQWLIKDKTAEQNQADGRAISLLETSKASQYLAEVNVKFLDGLGSEAEDLPGFVGLTSLGKGGQNQPIAARQWAAGLLPSRFQGVPLRGKGDPVLYLGTPAGVTHAQQKDVVDVINAINAKYDTIVDDPEISTRIVQYEMAFKMQTSVPALMDIKAEGTKTLELYGCQPGDGSFASNCLLARRLAERGVRFIQLYHKDWDHHGGVKEGIAFKAQEIDRACMALITDLKQRVMLEETLIVWAGEFGRTPMSQGGDGRDSDDERDCQRSHRDAAARRARNLHLNTLPGVVAGGA